MPASSYPLVLKGLNNYTPISREPVDQAALAAYREKQVASFACQIEIIEAAMAVGSIANPVWVDVKFTMGNLLERAWDGLETKSWNWRDLSDDVTKIVSGLNIYHPEMHSILGKIEKLRKVKDKHPMLAEWLAVFEELAPLGDAFKVLSKNTVKRQPKPVEDRVAKYNAPSVSGTATAKVRDLLNQITEESKLVLEQRIADGIEHKLKCYMDAQKKALAEDKVLGVYEFFCPSGHVWKDHDGYHLVSGLVNGGINKETAVRKPGYKAQIAKIAEDNASHVREDFVYKNLEKIASIVEAKGNYKSGKIISREISLVGLTGMLQFHFTDGSNFIVQNAVVGSYSCHGKYFHRYPLTFHDVIMPNGKKMGRPSEQRMNEIFVKG